MKQIGGIWIPSGDMHFEPFLKGSPLVDGKATYQLKKYQAVMRHVKRRQFAVDVGGHVGLWSRVMRRDFAHVWAFEPLAEHRACFLQNVDLSNVELFPYAVSNMAGVLRIHMPSDNTGHAHVLPDEGEEVQAVQLDALHFYDQIDFLKIDVEGYELLVVEGATETIRKHKPVIIIEQKPNGNAERYGFEQTAAVKVLQKMGMKQAQVISGDHIMIW